MVEGKVPCPEERLEQPRFARKKYHQNPKQTQVATHQVTQGPPSATILITFRAVTGASASKSAAVLTWRMHNSSPEFLHNFGSYGRLLGGPEDFIRST